MLNVTHYYREPRSTGVSIEGIFRTVKKDLEGKALITDHYCNPALSRVQNTLQAKKHSGDVNHITGDVNFLAMGLGGKKNILTIHDLGYYENPVHPWWKKAIYSLLWFRLPLKYIDMVTVVSEFTKEKLVKYFHFPEEKIKVIPDPVKPVFTFVKKELLNTPPVILMLGTGKHKNLDNLIAAAKDTNFHLDIVGWPAADEIARLKEYNISHKIYNKLSDKEIFERYVACDVVFMASLYEGFGMPIIEAQAVGRPVVTSNIGAMLEVGKGAAILVNPLDPAGIKSAITHLVSDRWHYDEVVEKGLRNAAKYDHNIIAEQYLLAYKELAAGS